MGSRGKGDNRLKQKNMGPGTTRCSPRNADLIGSERRLEEVDSFTCMASNQSNHLFESQQEHGWLPTTGVTGMGLHPQLLRTRFRRSTAGANMGWQPALLDTTIIALLDTANLRVVLVHLVVSPGGVNHMGYVQRSCGLSLGPCCVICPRCK